MSAISENPFSKLDYNRSTARRFHQIRAARPLEALEHSVMEKIWGRPSRRSHSRRRVPTSTTRFKVSSQAAILPSPDLIISHLPIPSSSSHNDNTTTDAS